MQTDGSHPEAPAPGQERKGQLGDRSSFLLSARSPETLPPASAPRFLGGAHSEGLSPLLSARGSRRNSRQCSGERGLGRGASDRAGPPPTPSLSSRRRVRCVDFMSHCHPAASPRGRGLGSSASPRGTPTQGNRQKPPPPGAAGAGRWHSGAGARGSGNGGAGEAHSERTARWGRGPQGSRSGALTLLEELFFFIVPGCGPGAGAWGLFPGRVAEMPPAPPPLRPPSPWRTRLLCSSGYTRGRPPRSLAHTRTPAPRPSAPSIPPPTRPGSPAAARPRRSPGPARCGRPGPHPAPRGAIQRPLTLRVQNKGRIAEPELARSPASLCFWLPGGEEDRPKPGGGPGLGLMGSGRRGGGGGWWRWRGVRGRGSPRSRPAPPLPTPNKNKRSSREGASPAAGVRTARAQVAESGCAGQRTGKSFLLQRVSVCRGPCGREFVVIDTSSSLQSFRPDLSLSFRRTTLRMLRSPLHTEKGGSEWLNDLQTHCQCREEYNGL